MKATVIINPVSGSGLDASRLTAFFRTAADAGIRLRPFETRHPGHARELLSRSGSEMDVVIAVGGDGTVREVAEYLAGTGIPLVIWPKGTENLVARSLGFRPDPDLLLEALTHGTDRYIDLGRANGRLFMVIAGVGFDAEVVQRLTRQRDGHITHLSYTAPLWRTFWEHRWPPLIVTGRSPEGPLTWSGPGMVFVGNMARYALGLRLARDAVDDDGLLDLVAVGCDGRIALIGHAIRTLCRKHLEHPTVFNRKFTWLRVEPADPAVRVPVQIDGENAGFLPLDIAIRPGALRVKVPPNRPGR